MWKSLELRDIRVFLAVADELNFARGAQTVGVTGSYASQVISRLEVRVGAPLFERTSRRVRLTPLGEDFRDQVGAAYQTLEAAYRRVTSRASGVTGTLRLGLYSPLVGGPRLLAIIKRFEDRHPGCDIEVVDTGLRRDLADWLRHDELDIVGIRLPRCDPGLMIGPVMTREDRWVAVARDHPLAGRASVPVEDIADFPISDAAALPDETRRAFSPEATPGGRPLRRLPVHSLAEANLRAATGELVHLTVRSFFDHHSHPNVVGIPVGGLPPSETALAWLADRDDPKVAAFAACIVEVLDDPAA